MRRRCTVNTDILEAFIRPERVSSEGGGQITFWMLQCTLNISVLLKRAPLQKAGGDKLIVTFC